MPRLLAGKVVWGKARGWKWGQDVAVILWIAGPGVGADLGKGEVSFPQELVCPAPR